VTKPIRALELLSRVRLNLKLQETLEKLEHYEANESRATIQNR